MNIVDLDSCLLCPCSNSMMFWSVSLAGAYCQPFQNEGAPTGAGADQDSNWRLSIDPCRKCHFIWGLKGDGFLIEGAQAPQSRPSLTTFPAKVYAWQLRHQNDPDYWVYRNFFLGGGGEGGTRKLEDGRKNSNLECDIRCNFVKK